MRKSPVPTFISPYYYLLQAASVVTVFFSWKPSFSDRQGFWNLKPSPSSSNMMH